MLRCNAQANVQRIFRGRRLVAPSQRPPACHRSFHACRPISLQLRYNLADFDKTPLLTASDASLQRAYLEQTGASADDLVILPGFLTEAEQKILLTASLLKLDNAEDREQKKHRRDYLRGHKGLAETAGKLCEAMHLRCIAIGNAEDLLRPFQLFCLMQLMHSTRSTSMEVCNLSLSPRTSKADLATRLRSDLWLSRNDSECMAREPILRHARPSAYPRQALQPAACP